MIWIVDIICNLVLSSNSDAHPIFVPFISVVFGTDKSEINGRVPLIESLEILNVMPAISIGRTFIGAVLLTILVSVPLPGTVTLQVRISILALQVKISCSWGQTDTLSRGSKDKSLSAPIILYIRPKSACINIHYVAMCKLLYL